MLGGLLDGGVLWLTAWRVPSWFFLEHWYGLEGMGGIVALLGVFKPPVETVELKGTFSFRAVAGTPEPFSS